MRNHDWRQVTTVAAEVPEIISTNFTPLKETYAKEVYAG
jgi:hypothetical protein